ncbi:MAG: tocopherol cyclase family protein [Actinomycetes bacterium]
MQAPRKVSSRANLVSAFRATGADLPYGDPLVAHGVGMEGYFWRVTDVERGRVLIALIGVNDDGAGGSWATVGLGAHPNGFLRAGALDGASASIERLGARTDDGCFVGGPDSVHVDLGPKAQLDLKINNAVRWPRKRFGGSSWFQSIPALNQYWHPHILDGIAEGHAVIDGERWDLNGSRVYAEKNWGRGGFPVAWWWGQAQGFADPDACVCFAGGRVESGPLGVEVTALVINAGGQFLRLGDPILSPVKAEVSDEHWLLKSRSARWEVVVEGEAPLGGAHVLPVPLPAERRNIAAALEHLGGRMRVEVRRRGGEVVWSGTSMLAGLEHGGRERAESEAARRGGRPDGAAGPVGPLPE